MSLLPPLCPTCTVERCPHTKPYAVQIDAAGTVGFARCPVCGALVLRPIDLAHDADQYLTAFSPG